MKDFHIGEVYEAINKADAVRLNVEKILLNQSVVEELVKPYSIYQSNELTKGFVSTFVGFPVEISEDVENFAIVVK